MEKGWNIRIGTLTVSINKMSRLVDLGPQNFEGLHDALVQVKYCEIVLTNQVTSERSAHRPQINITNSHAVIIEKKK